MIVGQKLVKLAVVAAVLGSTSQALAENIGLNLEGLAGARWGQVTEGKVNAITNKMTEKNFIRGVQGVAAVRYQIPQPSRKPPA